MIGAVVISDRGDRYLPGCLANLAEYLPSWVPVRVVDDSAHLLGMAGAVRAAWQIALDEGWDFLYHAEEDFLALGPIPVSEMAAILDLAPHLAQVVLLRQPVSAIEQAAGGLIQLDPFEYHEKSFGEGATFLEHGPIRDWGFSCNPCLVPKRVLELGYPDGNEREMTERCTAAGLRFAFYGVAGEPPRVEHVGTVRGEGWRL